MELINSVDSAILLWIQQWIRVDWLNPVIKIFTSLGNAGILWILMSLVLVCFRKTRKAGLISGLALVFSLIFTNLCLKPLISRVRPYDAVEGLIPLLRSADPNSFPSGHTCAAFAAGIAWSRALPAGWMRKTAVVQAVLMGLSRLYVGVHYPTDVLTGAVIGTLCGMLALFCAAQLEKRRKTA